MFVEEEKWECPECGESMATKGKGLHIGRHRKAEKKLETKEIKPDPEPVLIQNPVSFELTNFIAINGIDYPPGKYYIGQVIYTHEGPKKIDKALKEELMSRDSIATQAEHRLYNPEKVSIEFETKETKYRTVKI